MSPEPNALREDISYLRQLAEQGRRAPILSGAFLAAAGAVFGTACFIQWAMILRAVGGAGPMLLLWGGAMVLFLLIWLMVFFQMRGQAAAAKNASNVAFSSSWLGIGIGITVGCIAVGLAGAFVHQPAIMLSYPPMVFAFYGTAWFVSGVLVHRRWMYGAAAGAFVFAIVLGLLSAQPWQLPVMGVALYLTLTWPGALLMREKAL